MLIRQLHRARFQGSRVAVLQARSLAVHLLADKSTVRGVPAGDRGLIPVPGEFVAVEARVDVGDIHVAGPGQRVLGQIAERVAGEVMLGPTGLARIAGKRPSVPGSQPFGT